MQRGAQRARGVVESHAVEPHRRAATHRGQGQRLRWRDDGRARLQQLHQPFGRARGAQQVAIDFGQHRDRRDEQDHIDDGLPQVPGADLAVDHGLCALVQPPQQRAESGRDDEGHQHRAQPRAPDGGGEGVFGRGIEACRLALFLRVALHHGDGVQDLGGNRARIGHPVLAGARKLANAPPEVERGQHHQHQDAHHLRHHIGVGDDEHQHRAQAHHGVAQAHRQARADDGLHERGVGRQAAEHFAGLRGLEELWALRHHVRIDGVAQVCGDAFAEPGDHVEARGREHAERRADGKQLEEMFAQGHHPLAGVGSDEALVDQGLERDGKDERAHRSEHEEQYGQRDAAVVGAQEGQQAAQRAHRLGGDGGGRSGGRGGSQDGAHGHSLGARPLSPTLSH